MLTIIAVTNLSPRHIGHFINGNGRKLTTGHIVALFTLSGLNFVFSSFKTHLSANYTLRNKNRYLPFFFFCFNDLFYRPRLVYCC